MQDRDELNLFVGPGVAINEMSNTNAGGGLRQADQVAGDYKRSAKELSKLPILLPQTSEEFVANSEYKYV